MLRPRRRNNGGAECFRNLYGSKPNAARSRMNKDVIACTDITSAPLFKLP